METATESRAVLERMMEIVRSRDYDKLDEVLHPDFVQEIPQSGERVSGIADFRKILENMPGPGPGIEIDPNPYVAGDESHYIMTPGFTVVKVEGAGDQLTSYVKLTYPDGSRWYVVTLSSYKDGKMIKRVDFYAPLFDPPEWRSQWVDVGSRS